MRVVAETGPNTPSEGSPSTGGWTERNEAVSSKSCPLGLRSMANVASTNEALVSYVGGYG